MSLEVHTLCDIQCLQEKVREAAGCAREKLSNLSADPMEALHTLKFEQFGYQPNPEKEGRLNLIEQLNQTFTIMASLAASRMLLECFPESCGLKLNLGTASGRDIASICPNVVEAEVFTAVTPSNNGKRTEDIKEMDKSSAAKRYVFFYSPSCSPGLQGNPVPGSKVRVWALSREEIM